MTLSQEQFNIAFGVIIALIVALTGWLQKQSSAKRHAETQSQLKEVQAKVDAVHAAVAPDKPTSINIQPNPFTTTGNAGTIKLEDGHELPSFTKPPARPLP